MATFSFNTFSNALNDTVNESGVTFANLAKKWEKESDGKILTFLHKKHAEILFNSQLTT
jgi:hypothetical protein